jgi:competence protein ComFA
VNSQRVNREGIIAAFKKRGTGYLITTSVLERGVTVKNLQVIVFAADEEKIYDSSALIQIAGRSGRKMDAPDGEVTYLAEKNSRSMQDSIREIQFCNTFL